MSSSRKVRIDLVKGHPKGSFGGKRYLEPFKPKAYHPNNCQLKCCDMVENQENIESFNKPEGYKSRQQLRSVTEVLRGRGRLLNKNNGRRREEEK